MSPAVPTALEIGMTLAEYALTEHSEQRDREADRTDDRGSGRLRVRSVGFGVNDPGIAGMR